MWCRAQKGSNAPMMLLCGQFALSRAHRPLYIVVSIDEARDLVLSKPHMALKAAPEWNCCSIFSSGFFLLLGGSISGIGAILFRLPWLLFWSPSPSEMMGEVKR